MDDTDRGDSMDDFRIELFIFPDGTAVEMMVFDQPERDASSSAPSGSSAGRASAAPSTPAPPAPGSCCVADRVSGLAAVASADEVNVCPVCHGDLVHPVDWRRAGDSMWRLRLRCPECETERSVVLGRPEVERLNRELYHGTRVLAREAQRVERQNLEDEAHRFIAALRRGDIQPIDF
mgnify:CR=1 FL=1